MGSESYSGKLRRGSCVRIAAESQKKHRLKKTDFLNYEGNCNVGKRPHPLDASRDRQFESDHYNSFPTQQINKNNDALTRLN